MRKASHSAGVRVGVGQDSVDFIAIAAAFVTLVLSHRLLQHERRAGASASSVPNAFLIFCLARENIVSIETTVRP